MYREDERDFLFSHFTRDSRVLEYGSGESSIEIARKVAFLMTIEHMPNWFDHLQDKLPGNAHLLLRKRNDGEYENLVKPEYGSYAEWSNYVNAPFSAELTLGFDVIFIDGAARVACASMCKELGHKDTVVFIHDCNGMKFSRSYEDNDWLEPVDLVFTMRKFKIKCQK